MVFLRLQRRSQFDQDGGFGTNTTLTARKYAVASPKTRNPTPHPRMLCVQPAGPLAGPQGWRVPRHRLSGFGLDRLPTARRISRQAPSVEKRTGAFVFLTRGKDIPPRVFWRRDRPFRARPVCAMLPGCLTAAVPGITEPPPANCWPIYTSCRIHGRAGAGPRSTTLKLGA